MILSNPFVHLFCRLARVLVCVTVLRVETVLLETLGTFSVNFLVLLYSFGDATENWAAASIRLVSCSLKMSFSGIDSSDPISACGKGSSFFLCALLYVYQCWNSFALQYHKSLFPASFQLYWKKSFTLKNEKTLSAHCSCPLLDEIWTCLLWLPGGIPEWHPAAVKTAPAFVPCLSTTSLSVREHSLVSRGSTVSLKVFDEGPCQISSGNTNMLYISLNSLI